LAEAGLLAHATLASPPAAHPREVTPIQMGTLVAHAPAAVLPAPVRTLPAAVVLRQTAVSDRLEAAVRQVAVALSVAVAHLEEVAAVVQAAVLSAVAGDNVLQEIDNL